MPKFAYDLVRMKPGCVILQAALAGRWAEIKAQLFDSNLWLLAPTPDLHVYETSEEQLEELVRMTANYHKIKRGKRR